jgi:hypothetical protein
VRRERAEKKLVEQREALESETRRLRTEHASETRALRRRLQEREITLARGEAEAKGLRDSVTEKDARIGKLERERESDRENAEALGGYARELEARLDRATAEVQALNSSRAGGGQGDGSGPGAARADAAAAVRPEEPGQQRLVERVMELQSQCDSLRHDLHASEMKGLALAAQLREGTAGTVCFFFFFFFTAPPFINNKIFINAPFNHIVASTIKSTLRSGVLSRHAGGAARCGAAAAGARGEPVAAARPRRCRGEGSCHRAPRGGVAPRRGRAARCRACRCPGAVRFDF